MEASYALENGGKYTNIKPTNSEPDMQGYHDHESSKDIRRRVQKV